MVKLNDYIVFNILIILMISSVTNTYSQKSSTLIKRLDGTNIHKDTLTKKLDHLVKEAQVHGLFVTVFENNKTKYHKVFGYKDYEQKATFSDTTNMYGASLSKAVFGVLVMKLIEENIIDLDSPLESYLTKKIYEYKPLTKWHDHYSDLQSDSFYHRITARMCLSHTSGFPNWRWFTADQKLKTDFIPGTKYHYSGEGLVYLQVVLEKITGKSLESLAHEKIFKPLGMKKSSYQWQNEFQRDFAYGHDEKGKKYEKDTDNEPRSASTLETTSRDLRLFFEAVLQKKILTQKSWKELMRTQIRIKSLTQFGPNSNIDTSLYDYLQLGYGLGWGTLQSPYGKAIFKEGHGSGFQHYCILFPEAQKGVLILTNSDNGEKIFKEILDITIKDIYTPWRWQNYIPYNFKE